MNGLSLNAPTIAVLPSVERATELPCRAPDEQPCTTQIAAPEPTSFFPCWVQTPPLLVQIHTAPTPLLSRLSPMMAVFPSPERATVICLYEVPTGPEPTSLLPCWVQTPSFLVHTQAAPAPPLSNSPPTIAVLPSAEMATASP